MRNPDATSFSTVQPAENSRLIVVKIEATSEQDPTSAIQQLTAMGITSVDILIVNAGINPTSAAGWVSDINVSDFRMLFEVNTISFITLLKALQPLLRSATDPKLLALTSNSSQITDMAPFPTASYGASKAALNYLVKHTHVANPWLTAWVMNPGFVETDNGFEWARVAGMEKPPQTLQESVAGLINKIDHATKSDTSGNFYNFNGAPMSY